MTWICHRSGDCCQQPPYVVMTTQERDALGRSGSITSRPPVFAEHDTPGFVRLLASPCPYWVEKRCTVYSVRPYQCRRFLCFRERGEPFDPDVVAFNLTKSRDHKRQYAVNQRQAQRWARKHGWTDDDGGMT